MPYPKLEKFGGPYSRVIEAVAGISDGLTEGYAKRILSPYGLSVRRFSEYACRTVFRICEKGHENDEPPEGEQFYTRGEINELCKMIERGEIDPNNL